MVKTILLASRMALSLLLMLSVALPSLGGINLQTGNFYISYVDHNECHPGSKLDVGRTYNSFSDFNGLFGFGWGTKIDTYLEVMGDGSVVIREWGGGQTSVFMVPQPDQKALNKCIQQIVLAAIRNKSIDNTPRDIAAYRSKLTHDLNYRVKQWSKFRKVDLLPHMDIGIGTKLFLVDDTKNYLVRTEAGFTRYWNDGTVDYFNDGGRLLEHYTVGERLLFKLVYDAQNRLIAMQDEGKHSFAVTTTESGKIKSIKSAGGVSTYRYDDSDNLVETVDTGGNRYEYAYDNIHNLIRISYSDNTHLELSYEPGGSSVTRIVDRDGAVSLYRYYNFYKENGQKNRDHYATEVIKSTSSKAEADTAYYEYKIGTASNGSRYREYIKIVRDGVKMEYYQHPVYKSTERLLFNDTLIQFSYYDNGNLKERLEPALSYQLKFDEYWRITELVKQELHSGQQAKASYTYEGENLVKVIHKGDTISIGYQGGRITQYTYGSDVWELYYSKRSSTELAAIRKNKRGKLKVEEEEVSVRARAKKLSPLQQQLLEQFNQMRSKLTIYDMSNFYGRKVELNL